MEKKITAIENGIESTFTRYDPSHYKYIEEMILLIKIANTKGKKILVMGDEYYFNMLIEKFKIDIENYTIKIISWIDDFVEIYSLDNASVFIFGFDSYRTEPEYQIDTFGSYEISLIIDENRRKDLKESFTMSSKNDNVNYFFSESLISEAEKQRIEKFDYRFIDISQGKIDKKNLNASNLKFRIGRFKDYKLDLIFESGICSSKPCTFYYPHTSKNEDESFEEAGIIEILYPNTNEYNKYLARFLWVYLGKKNVGIEKVPTLVKDEFGNYIFPPIFSNYDDNSDQTGLKKYIPSEEEIFELNSINSIMHYLKHSEVEFFNNEFIASEIQNVLDSIIGDRIKFIPTKTIFTLKLNLEEDTSSENIFLLNAEEFLKFDGSYFNQAFDESKQIENWAVYYRRKLKYIL